MVKSIVCRAFICMILIVSCNNVPPCREGFSGLSGESKEEAMNRYEDVCIREGHENTLEECINRKINTCERD